MALHSHTHRNPTALTFFFLKPLHVACWPRCGIAELRRPLRRALPATIMLHCDPSRIGARKMYESSGFVEAQRLRAYYGDGRDALLMRLAP